MPDIQEEPSQEGLGYLSWFIQVLLLGESVPPIGFLGCLKDEKKSLELTQGKGISLCTWAYFHIPFFVPCQLPNQMVVSNAVCLSCFCQMGVYLFCDVYYL